MSSTEPRPGHGYVVREKLGQGAWKETYRAVFESEWHDRALLRFRKPPSVDELLSELKAVHALSENQPKNVAKIYGVFPGEDGHVYLAEELLYRSLDKIAPLRSGARFMGFARDLCAGLAALHKRGILHTDIKLENCGIDFADCAKIFDFGRATRKGSKPEGSILTRAPELFGRQKNCTKESDVWALGATLYALRTGNYPFALHEEWLARPSHSNKERERFDAKVRERARERGAEAQLKNRLETALPAGPRQLLGRMLHFDATKRPTAQDAHQRWEELITEWLAPPKKAIDDDDAVATEIEQYLLGVSDGSVGMSIRQWEKTVEVVKRIESAKKFDRERIDRLRDLMYTVSALRLGR